MIDLDDIWKSYRVNGFRKHVLRGIDFRFPSGRNVAIMGHNGAGKSTLMRIIAGSELPDHGRVRRHGRASWPMGFSGGFNGSMTGIENISFVARLYGENPRRVVRAVEDFARLGPSLDLPVRTYSSGMKARLAFGLSLAIDFDCYLVDEITSVGDKAFREASREAFARKTRGASMIMISHSRSEISTWCDCGVLLNDGQLEFHETTAGLLAAHDRMMEGHGAGSWPAVRMP
ncbi:ABC transporter ATP-binding protein [Rhodobacter sp. CZR27]|uniref:ABC transporter ATP-binding protein n=1 Tax=Rhodobacter sp. CZR27 TaxID=2033869 RepID=UPI000BBE7165|nr:ABC transporter ATP-binding protein [Rhodobacter sp. CZR27]